MKIFFFKTITNFFLHKTGHHVIQEEDDLWSGDTTHPGQTYDEIATFEVTSILLFKSSYFRPRDTTHPGQSYDEIVTFEVASILLLKSSYFRATFLIFGDTIAREVSLPGSS